VDTEISNRVMRILSEKIVGAHYDGKITVDTPLLSSGLNLDSVAVLELVMEVENEFGIVFEDADLSTDLFKTAGTVARAVEQKIRNRPVVASAKRES